MYNFKIDEINVCHCGDLEHVLNPEQVHEVGKKA
ncbi:MBL fold metallo-hydrolase [Desulfosporosinus acididurans]|nr:MBL fold metallo-hydrolase [Desulfosporosinus acididurans]